jgi:hypothetical protein
MQCFKYIVHDPPRPLTEEDIWFQIGHVYEQQKDVSEIQLILLIRERDGLQALYSTILPRLPIVVSLSVIQTMPKFSSSSDGCIISRAIASRVKNVLLSIWRSLLDQVCHGPPTTPFLPFPSPLYGKYTY